MNDPNDLILQTVGDLELNRRFLLARVNELEAENALLKANKEEEPDASRSDDGAEHFVRQP